MSFEWLLDWAPYMDRWHCIRGDSPLGSCLLWANGATWAVYWLMVIPLVKVYRAHRDNFGAAWLFSGFAAFIFLCGTHHGLYDLAFRWPSYRLAAANDVLMAVVSAVILVAFWARAEDLCLIRPHSEVIAERDEAERALLAGKAAHEQLEVVVRGKDQVIVDLNNALNDLRHRLDPLEARFGRELSFVETRKLIAEMMAELERPSGPKGDHGG